MKLNEIGGDRKTHVGRALKENFEINLDYGKLNLKKTSIMLNHVRGLLKEARASRDYHGRHSSSGYMKLVMMEQGLADHWQELRVQRQMVIENEEVQKSQVILAAQDMVDSVQKMIEQISKMKAEELPAVVTGISNEIGTSESEQFNSSVGDALASLEEALNAAKGGLTGAVGAITGEGGGFEAGGEPAGGEMEPPGDDMADMGGQEPEADMGGQEEEPEGELPPPPEEEEPAGPAGRGLR